MKQLLGQEDLSPSQLRKVLNLITDLTDVQGEVEARLLCRPAAKALSINYGCCGGMLDGLNLFGTGTGGVL